MGIVSKFLPSATFDMNLAPDDGSAKVTKDRHDDSSTLLYSPGGWMAGWLDGWMLGWLEFLCSKSHSHSEHMSPDILSGMSHR